MTLLVTVESRHGATEEIGRRVARVLIEAGWPVDVLRPSEVQLMTPYDAVVIGSGVYAGNWLAPARELVERFAIELRDRPVWLFSSGPIGDPPKPIGDPAGIAPLMRLIHPRGHRIFSGRLVDQDLHFSERLMVKAVRASFGDFRDWPAVEAWARDIALELAEERRAPVPAGHS